MERINETTIVTTMPWQAECKTVKYN